MKLLTRRGLHRGGAAILATALCQWGCSDGLVEEPPIELSLGQVEQGGLQLHGSPMDPAYTAIYPNPKGVETMTVRVSSLGRFRMRCTSGDQVVTCSEPPFFAAVTPTQDGHRVRVWDLAGVVVVDRTFGGGAAGASTGTAEQGSSVEPGWSEDMGEFGVGFPAKPGKTTPPAPSGEGTGSPPSPMGQPPSPTEGTRPPGTTAPACPTREEIKQAFCDKANERLRELSLDYQLDCADLGDGMDPASWRFDLTKIPADNPGCNAVIQPANEAVRQYYRCDPSVPFLISNWGNNARYIMLSRGVCGLSPLLLDLAGDGIALSSVDQGVRFDLQGDGRTIQCAWPTRSDDAWLSLDRNANGTIDGADELFGNVTAGRAYADGFAALAELDDNRDGWIDRQDALFGKLRLWQDRDRNGVSQPDELVSLPARNIDALALGFHRLTGAAGLDGHGNGLALVSRFRRSDGSVGTLVDAHLRFEATSDALALEQSLRQALGPLYAPTPSLSLP